MAIISVLKNEHDILEEWLQHHSDEGIDKFYLVDNGSVPPLQVIDPTLRQKTRITRSTKRYAQTELLNTLLAQARNDGHSWVLSIDADEYVWPTDNASSVATVLKHLKCQCTGINLVALPFGDGFNQKMPTSVVDGFLYRAVDSSRYGKLAKGWKWAARVDHIDEAAVHPNKIKLKYTLSRMCSTSLVLNHYQILTFERFMRVKATRGDVNSEKFADLRTKQYFDEANQNVVYDTRLKERVGMRKLNT